MTRLVHILDAMDEEPQGEAAIVDGFALVLERQPELIDLVTTQPFVETLPENRESYRGSSSGTST